jgi:putative oxidoreductase
MRIAFLIGRIITGGFYLWSASHHFLNHAALTAYAGMKGVPLPGLAVIGTGILLAIGGITILLGWQPKIGVAAVALFFIGVTPFMHNFWAGEAAQRAAQVANFTKNSALMGSALMFLMVPEPWPLGLGRSKKK